MTISSIGLMLLVIIFINILIGIYGVRFDRNSRTVWIVPTGGWITAFLQAWMNYVK